jgi:hypothetical protein
MTKRAGKRLSEEKAASRMPRVAAGVDHGKQVTLYDAAKYAVEAWSDLSERTLNNCFIKADIIPALKNKNASEEPENFDAFLALFRNCSFVRNIDTESLERAGDSQCLRH